ncbi:hypothetical protein TNCV_1666501 [Trichonephila clavipes]|nr:hypothetical protein TNCV_1666501 [Trichonephila clavipes]
MDVCKCIVPSRHEGTVNSRRAASPLVRVVEGVERWQAPDHPQVSSLTIGVGTSQIVLLNPVYMKTIQRELHAAIGRVAILKLLALARNAVKRLQNAEAT